MTAEQAINYLRSSGYSEEQINTVADALRNEARNQIILSLVDIKIRARIDTPRRAKRMLGDLLKRHDFDDTVNISEDFIKGAWSIADIMIDRIKQMQEEE